MSVAEPLDGIVSVTATLVLGSALLCVTPLAEHDFDFVPAGKEPNEPAVVCARARASTRPLDPTLATDTHAGRYYSRRLVRAA